MPTLDESAPGVLTDLAAHYGRPSVAVPTGPPRFEAIVAALLARSVDPRKAAAGSEALRAAGLLTPDALAGADPRQVADVLKAGGSPLVPRALGPILRVARWLAERHGGSAEALADGSTAQIREELLGLNGIGPPSADAVLLTGLGRSAYPVDRASYRIAARHGWLDPWAEYDEARAVLERLAPEDPANLARLSAWLERVGRDFCKPGGPRCEKCPLRSYLPDGGPVEGVES